MTYTLSASIACIPFEIITSRKTVFRFLCKYFSGYQIETSPYFSIIIDGAGNNLDYKTPEQIIPEIRRNSPDSFSVIDNASSEYCIGSINTNTKRCILYTITYRSMYLLTSAIRTCIQFFLEQNDGFFIHAACGMVKGKGVIFTGESTAGKSTALRNLNPDRIIAEDAAAIRLIDNEIYMFSTPFKGDASDFAVLNYICFPRKSIESPELKRVQVSEMILELIANALFAAPSCSMIMDSVLSTIHQCSNIAYGYDCLFHKTTNLFPVFDEYGLFN